MCQIYLEELEKLISQKSLERGVLIMKKRNSNAN